MFNCLKYCGILTAIACIFVLSGAVATLFLYYTGCVYTSSGVFSIAFLGMVAALWSLWHLIMDITQFF